MEITRNELQSKVKQSNFTLPQGTDINTGKLSRSENYLNLPYLILDYPTLFLSGDIFAFRTMFWWGNFFSSTFHLQGKSSEKYRFTIANNIENLIRQEIFVGVGDTPWQYQYEENNYVPITLIQKQHISNHKFFKLSKKIDMENGKVFPNFQRTLLSSS